MSLLFSRFKYLVCNLGGPQSALKKPFISVRFFKEVLDFGFSKKKTYPTPTKG